MRGDNSKSAQEKALIPFISRKQQDMIFIFENKALQNTPLSPEQTNEHIHGINEEQSENRDL